MSTSDDEKYENDSREACKYGDKCYQQNPDHQKRFKHPPKNNKRKNNIQDPHAKRVKVDQGSSKDDDSIETQEQKKEVISSSDSEESNNVPDVNKPKEESVATQKKKEVISSSDSEESNNVPDVKEEKKSNKPFDPKKFIKSRFLVQPPEDFYYFWDVCKQLKATNPRDALSTVGLKLVGPFDVLAGKFKNVKKTREEYLRHWRYFHDPPEVLTVLRGDTNTGYHIGYCFDSPDKPPVFLVSNCANKDGVFTKMGDNIFTAVSLYLEEFKKSADPFKKMAVTQIMSKIKSKAEEFKLNLNPHTQAMKEREFKVVAKTMNKIGLVVPYNKKTQQGYRELSITDKELVALLTKIASASPEKRTSYLSELQHVLTNADLALDECDFGTGVKLGWEILYHGVDCINPIIQQYLANAYRFLDKEAFARIVEAHMSQRKKGSDLSIV